MYTNGRNPELFEGTIESALPTMSELADKRMNFLKSTNKMDIKNTGSYTLSTTSQRIEKDNTSRVLHNHESTPLTSAFFSSTNVDNIQDLLKLGVYNKTKLQIDKQSYEEILLVMRYIYLTYANHPEDFKKGVDISKQMKLKMKYTNEISRLNDLTIRYMLPKVITEINGQLHYINTIFNPIRVMDSPINTKITGTKEYKSVTEVLGAK
jgi:hypothetical protein